MYTVVRTYVTFSYINTEVFGTFDTAKEALGHAHWLVSEYNYLPSQLTVAKIKQLTKPVPATAISMDDVQAITSHSLYGHCTHVVINDREFCSNMKAI